PYRHIQGADSRRSQDGIQEVRNHQSCGRKGVGGGTAADESDLDQPIQHQVLLWQENTPEDHQRALQAYSVLGSFYDDARREHS
ncbi:hypothetical protein BGZ97_011267, partial [Linnemannia gamsii]